MTIAKRIVALICSLFAILLTVALVLSCFDDYVMVYDYLKSFAVSILIAMAAERLAAWLVPLVDDKEDTHGTASE